MKNKIFVAVLLVASLSLCVKLFASTGEVTKNSAIVTLTSKNYEAETAKGLVFVDFWAAWCGPCLKMNPILEEIASENKSKVKVAKLNIDDEKDLATSKKVRSIPTIIVYKEGKEVERIVGVVTKDRLEKTIASYSK